MIEDDFYCTIKLKCGDEIFAKVAASDEDDRTMLIISSPVIINEIKLKSSVVGYKVEPWLKTTTEDMFIINFEDVLTMSESCDIEMILLYQNYLRKSIKTDNNETKINRRMGYLANVSEAKEILEKIFNKS